MSWKPRSEIVRLRTELVQERQFIAASAAVAKQRQECYVRQEMDKNIARAAAGACEYSLGLELGLLGDGERLAGNSRAALEAVDRKVRMLVELNNARIFRTFSR
jgi:hypothetical protein